MMTRDLLASLKRRSSQTAFVLLLLLRSSSTANGHTARWCLYPVHCVVYLDPPSISPRLGSNPAWPSHEMHSRILREMSGYSSCRY